MAKTRIFLKTPLFRGSFVNLAKPRKRDEDSDKEQYSIMICLPKKEQSTKAFMLELEKAIQQVSAEAHGKAIPKERLKHYPVKNGDDFENEDFHGFWCINAASNFKPSCIDVNGDELLTADELYSGAWYKVKISPWGWNNPKSGKGVSINLESAIKMKDDKRIGGGSNAKADFAEDVDSTGGDDDMGLDK